MSDRNEPSSRRRFLIAAGLGTVAVGLPLGVTRWNSTLPQNHVPGPPDDSPFDVDVFETLIAFLAAFFDTQFADIDVVDLSQRLGYAVRQDSGWRAPYASLAALLDAETGHAGGGRFSDADRTRQSEAYRRLAEVDYGHRGLRLRAFIDSEVGEAAHARQTTIPHLLRLYRHSGVPWRRRGYASWPGVAGDARAYTRPPGPNQC